MKDQVRATTLYVSDLDGTLLRDDATLGASSVRLINELIARGVMFTYATARSFSSSRKVTADLRLELPLVTYGGTMIADPHDGIASHVQLLPTSVVETTLEFCAAHGLQPVLHTYEHGRDHLRWMPDETTPGTQAFLDVRAGDPRLRPIHDDDAVDLTTVFYIAVLADRPALERLRDELVPRLHDCAHFLSHDPATPGYEWLELHALEGTKSAALRRLMDQVGATRLVAFGNNYNDLPMFELADESYAVSEAVPDVLAAATGIIGSNNEDAVALWLEANAR